MLGVFLACALALTFNLPIGVISTTINQDDYDKLMSHPRRVRHESTVGAGLPIIVTINRLLSSGDTIRRIVGSLSGTLGYVMSEVEDGKPFSQVVKTARRLGYVEPVLSILVPVLKYHVLRLKIGVPIMLLRNIDQSTELCNGTRLIVARIGSHVIEAEIISGSNIGHKIFIQRMILTPLDTRFPFKYQRRQFSVVVCFAMTINKSQGQSLSSGFVSSKTRVYSWSTLRCSF